MNVSELARKVRVDANELLEILPQFGFHVGKKAIKIDNMLAQKIVQAWPRINKELAYRKRQAEAKSKEEERISRELSSKEFNIPSIITVKDFAAMLNVPVVEIIKRLMQNGIMATVNQKIDFETAAIVADDFKVSLHLQEGGVEGAATADKLKEHLAKDTGLEKRAPVIVIMGHVDHGKTTLLDTIRKANVAGGEAGGITQHIGAYQVVHNGQKITFIDTPGHEAFTAMRSRGAKVADIAILVVAADDSIKPQTLEAIKIIQQAQIPMVVAINKIDKAGARPERVMQDLAQVNVASELFGGNVIMQEISAKNNINIDKLLDSILLIDEMEAAKIVGNPAGAAVGTIIESHVDKSTGPVATVLVQSGALKVGDELMINEVYYGKARSMKNYLNQNIDEAGPSTPVKIIGLKFAPKVGDFLQVATGEIGRAAKKVRDIDLHKEESAMTGILRRQQEEGEGEAVPSLNVIIKADTLGSLEVLLESLEKLSSPRAKVKVIKHGLGNLSDNDVNQAEKDKAMVIAFNVKTLPSAEKLAIDRGVEVKEYNVIYNLIDDVRSKLEKLIKPEVIKKPLGKLKVLKIFKTDKHSMILGGKVLEGLIAKGAKADIVRNGTLYETGEITNLQSGKMEVNEVSEGNECGFKYQGSPDVKEGDILDIYKEEIKEIKL